MTDQQNPSNEQLLSLFERMTLIRLMEERLKADAAAGKLPGGVHLYIGQEAVAVGVCANLHDADWITSTHRGHGHFLAKGGDPRAMMAEIWGKRTGICKGMGGSMHVADLSKEFWAQMESLVAASQSRPELHSAQSSAAMDAWR